MLSFRWRATSSMSASVQFSWADACQRLIAHGHAWQDIRHYTLAQVDAWLGAIDRQEQRQLANLLTVIATGSQGTGEAIRKAIQSLTPPCSKSQ